VGFIILIAAVAALAYRMTAPEDRARYLEIAIDYGAQLKEAAMRRHPAAEAMRAALRVRTRHLIVTPGLVAISAIVSAGLLFGAGAIGESDPLVGWGASLGPLTTNGEWWRLLTSTFLHTSLFHLMLSIAIVLQLGAILERLIGRVAFGAVYVSAGVFAGLISLSSRPVAVSIGSPGAIFGLYGLLIATLMWQWFDRRRARPQPDPNAIAEPELDQIAGPGVSPLAESNESRIASLVIPPIEMKKLGLAATVFFFYIAASGFISTAELTALVVGLGYGLVVARRAGDRPPGMRPAALGIAVAASVAVAYAIPLRNIADVKPEIARVIATEGRTATTYEAALEAFKKGRGNADAITQVAERTIMPELKAADARLAALKNVPPEHQPLVAEAREYLRLRYESWRLRVVAIRWTNSVSSGAAEPVENARWRLQAEGRFKSNLAALGNAEAAERRSLTAFERVRSAQPAATH
jgi:membrane associated rhomboid family serine protease